MSLRLLVCPQCGATLRLQANTQGKTVRCPGCKYSFRAERDTEPEEPDERTQPVRLDVSSSKPKKKASNPIAGNRFVIKIAIGLGAILLGLISQLFTQTSSPRKKPSDDRPAVAQNPPSPPGNEPTPPSPPLPLDTPAPPNPPEKPPQPDEWGPTRSELVTGTLPGTKGSTTFDFSTGPTPPEPIREAAQPFLVLENAKQLAPIEGIHFTGDGKGVVSASRDGAIRFWNAQTGEKLQSWRVPGTIHASAVGSGRLAVSVLTRDQRWVVYLLALKNGAVQRVLEGHTGRITALAFAGEARYLASASVDGEVRVWNPESGNQQTLLKHPVAVLALAWNPLSPVLATAGIDRVARLWGLSGKPPVELQGHTGAVCSVAWEWRGRFVVTGDSAGTIRWWSPTGEERSKIAALDAEKSSARLSSLAFLPGSRDVVFAGGTTLGLLDFGNGRSRWKVDLEPGPLTSSVLSPDGKMIALVSADPHRIGLYSAVDGKVVRSLGETVRPIQTVGWSADGKTLGWGFRAQGEGLDATGPLDVGFRLDRLELADKSGDRWGRARLTHDQVSLKRLDATSIALVSDGRTQAVLTSPLPGESIRCASMLEGERVVVGGERGLYLFDLRTRQLLREFTGQMGAITAVALAPSGRYFLTASTDQTLRIWHPGRKSPLFCLFVEGKDWLAWTPEGFHAHAPGAERLLGWQFDGSPERLPTVRSASDYRHPLASADVLRLLWRAGGDAREALTMARREGVTLGEGKTGSVPEVAILSPKAGDLPGESFAVKVEVRAKSTADAPLTALRLLVNGRPYRGRKGDIRFQSPRVGEAEGAWQVELPPGKHTLLAQALTTGGRGQSAVLEVTQSERVRAPKPNLYILACGISKYTGELKLTFPASDARLMSQTFKDHANEVFGKVEVRLCLDAQATRRGIEDGLAWLETMLTPNDVAIFFFAGHGVKDEENHFYLAPIDIGKEYSASAVSGERIKETLANMSGRVIAMLDCCHSGAVASEGVQPGQVDELVRDLAGEDYGVISMCASTSAEAALESSNARAGLFTRSLVDGLNGAADLNGDKVIFIHELDRYIEQKVREFSKGAQTPITARPPGVRTFPLARLP